MSDRFGLILIVMLCLLCILFYLMCSFLCVVCCFCALLKFSVVSGKRWKFVLAINLQSLHIALPVCTCVHVSPFYKDTSHSELGFTVLQSDLTWPSYLQIRPHSEVLGISTSTYRFWEDITQHMTVPHIYCRASNSVFWFLKLIRLWVSIQPLVAVGRRASGCPQAKIHQNGTFTPRREPPYNTAVRFQNAMLRESVLYKTTSTKKGFRFQKF